MNKPMKQYLAECVGTAVLVLVGCGAVAIGGLSGNPLINILAIGVAFGLTVTAMAYTIGAVSGAHINPAVTVAMLVAGRIKSEQAIGYILAQFAGALIGAILLWLLLSGRTGGYNIAASGLGQTGFSQYGVISAILAELLATLIFVIVILGSTAGRAPPQLAGLVIGLTLIALHLPFFSITGLSVNPARSFGPAVLVGGTALQQLWLFLVVPTIAGAIAGWVYRKKLLTL